MNSNDGKKKKQTHPWIQIDVQCQNSKELIEKSKNFPREDVQHHGPGGDLLRALPASSQHPPHGQCQMAPQAEPDMEQTIHSPQDHPEEVSILKWGKGGGM